MPAIANNSNINLISGNLLEARADAIVIVQTTEGTVGNSVKDFLNNLGIYHIDHIPLGEINPRPITDKSSPFKFLIFATILQPQRPTTYAIIRKIGMRLCQFHTEKWR